MSERLLVISGCEQCHHYRPMEAKPGHNGLILDRCRLRKKSFGVNDVNSDEIPVWCPLPVAATGGEVMDAEARSSARLDGETHNALGTCCLAHAVQRIALLERQLSEARYWRRHYQEAAEFNRATAAEAQRVLREELDYWRRLSKEANHAD